ncbi:uncharacterized protein LOC135488704 [Lineus longissimus]|uniref:uncharacterized protein LOC135488704 n=1 Tax=Lineus longissimus TaxID=88925 RepID=UPI00315D94FA
MTLRLILLAVIAVSVTNAMIFDNTDDGPEDMHFPVVRALNNILSKQFDQLYTLLLMKMKAAEVLAMKPDQKAMLDKFIMGRADKMLKMIDYAGARGLTPDIDDPQPLDLNNCDDVYGCWKLSLQMERDMYKALQEGYSSAGSHEDADAQARLVPLIQESLGALRFDKAIVAKKAAAAAKKQPKLKPLTTDQPTIVGGDGTYLDDIFSG